MRSVSFVVDKRLEQKAETLEMTKSIFSRAASYYAFVAVLQMLLLSVMLCVMERLLKKKIRKLHMKELCYLLLTPVTGILFVNIIMQFPQELPLPAIRLEMEV